MKVRYYNIHGVWKNLMKEESDMMQFCSEVTNQMTSQYELEDTR